MAGRKTVTDGQYSLDDYQLKEVSVRLCLRDGNPLYSASPISEPEEAISIMKDVMKDLDREMFCAVNLDCKEERTADAVRSSSTCSCRCTFLIAGAKSPARVSRRVLPLARQRQGKLRPLNYTVVSIGSLNSTIVAVQNVFKAAILSNASGIIALHNHPSGEIVPSKEDYDVTARIALAGQLMQTPLLDHVIVGGINGNLYSFRSEYPDLFRDDLDFDLIKDMLSGQKPPAKRKTKGSKSAEQRPAGQSARESALETLSELKQADQPPHGKQKTERSAGKEAR